MSRIDRVADLVDRLIAQSEMHETFLDASPWGILVTDKTFHIVYMNKTLQLMSGRSLNESMGEHMHILMPKEDWKPHVQHEISYIKKPHGRTGNHGLSPKILHTNGQIVPVEISLSPTKVEGQTFYFASIRKLETLFDTVEGKVIGS